LKRLKEPGVCCKDPEMLVNPMLRRSIDLGEGAFLSRAKGIRVTNIIRNSMILHKPSQCGEFNSIQPDFEA
jgi:hypothetical protein